MKNKFKKARERLEKIIPYFKAALDSEDSKEIENAIDQMCDTLDRCVEDIEERKD